MRQSSRATRLHPLLPRMALTACIVALAGCGSEPRNNVQLVPSTNAAPLNKLPQGMRVADAALAAGTPEVALQWTETLLAADPQNVEALLRNGRAQSMLGNAAGAASAYRRALAIDARQTEARVALAKLMLSERPSEAEAMFRTVLAESPSNVGVMNNLGVSLDLQAKHADAQAVYRKALAMAPELSSARQNLGLSLALDGQASEGVSMLDSAARLPAAGQTPDRRARDNLALALALNGRAEEAGRMLREALNPADASTALAGYHALVDATPMPAPAALAPVPADLPLHAAPRTKVAAVPLDAPATTQPAATPVKLQMLAATVASQPPVGHSAGRHHKRAASAASAESDAFGAEVAP